MDNSEIRYLGDMQRLEIRPGDIFVLRVPGSITDETATRLKAGLEEQLDGRKVIVLCDGLELGVVGQQ